jgi:hypothetical protein
MADTVVVGSASSLMADYPYLLQAATGDTPIQYSGANLRMPLDALFRTEGAVKYTDLAVTPGGGNSVNIAAGFAAIQGDSLTGQGKYLVGAYGTVNLVTPGLPVSGTRNHLIIAEILDKQAAGAAYGWQYRCIEDTTGTLPATPASALTLAKLTRLSTGNAAVQAGDLTDLRTFAYTGLNYSMASGTKTCAILTSAGSNAGPYTVTFPAGRFTSAPAVTLTQASLQSGTALYMVKFQNVTTTGFDIYVYTTLSSLNATGSTINLLVSWMAVDAP